MNLQNNKTKNFTPLPNEIFSLHLSTSAVGSLCAVLAHDHAQIGCVAIRIGQHQMALCIDFGLCDADAVSALDIAQINTCVVG